MRLCSLTTRLCGVVCLPCFFFAFDRGLSGQDLISAATPGGVVRLFSSDNAILESQEPRKDLPCDVTPAKPVLGFDMKFHAGYDVTVPLRDLAGGENQLVMVFRVTPEKRPDQPVYLSQRISVPAIAEDAGGEAFLDGIFDVGEGKFHVDWLMRDRAERVCSSFWDIEASLPVKDKQIVLDISPGRVQPADNQLFKEESPVERAERSGPLNVKIVVNFAPQDAESAALRPLDTNALVAILRNVARDPRIGKFSLVAFNMQEHRVIYRQEAASQIDFPALGESLTSLNLGTIDLKRLSEKHGDTEFLTDLLCKEIKEDDSKEQPDALIFAGPKVMLDSSVPLDTLKQLGEVKFPIFYMNYNLNPQANPWRDAIGSAVRSLRGVEYTISRPRDLFYAWSEIMGRIVKSKFGRTGAGGVNSAAQ